MKRYFLILLSCVLIINVSIGVLPVCATDDSEIHIWDGKTIKEPKLVNNSWSLYYEISSPEELAFISKTGGDWLHYNYVLTNDIYLNNRTIICDNNGDLKINKSLLNEWKPIGVFEGDFDGNGKTVYGLFVDTVGTNEKMAGLFSYVSGNISNLHIENAYVRGSKWSGGICAYARHELKESRYSIEGCSFSGVVVGMSFVGGIAAESFHNVLNCTNYGRIMGHHSNGIIYADNIGGLIGVLSGRIDNCANYGSVVSYGQNVGGLSGRNDMGSVLNKSINCGSVIGSTNVGGLVGFISSSSSITECANIGAVQGKNNVGGLIGYGGPEGSRSFQCYHSYNGGQIVGEEVVGGIIGNLHTYKLDTCYNFGLVSGNSKVGAIAGISESMWGHGIVNYCVYMKADSTITAFGNFEDVTTSVRQEESSFFCINDDNTLNWEGHSFNSTIPCDPKCQNCGYERIITHSYTGIGSDENNHWFVCSCGQINTESIMPHEGGIATCTNKAECDVCHVQYGHVNSNNHSPSEEWTNNSGYHFHTCLYGCGTEIDISQCIDSDKNHTCDICNASMGEHVAKQNEHFCEYCGSKMTECQDLDNDYYCDICLKRLTDIENNETASHEVLETTTENKAATPQRFAQLYAPLIVVSVLLGATILVIVKIRHK